MTDKNDVVKHDLPKLEAHQSEMGELQPKPFPTPRSRSNEDSGVLPGIPFFTDIEKDRAEREGSVMGATTSKVVDINKYPYSAVGRIVFHWNKRDWHGSAWAVDDQTIVTAGHNVQEDGIWSSNLRFQLRFQNGVSAEEVELSTVWSLKGWVRDEDLGYDLAVCMLSKKLAHLGQPLPVMGNVPPDQNEYDAVGYPGKPSPIHPFDGRVMWESRGDFVSASPSTAAPVKIKAENGMTQGCSGGPWIVRLPGNGALYANGLNSFGGGGDWMQSPYFGVGIANLLRASGALPQPAAQAVRSCA